MLVNALFSSRVRVALLRLFLLNPDAPFHAQSLSAQIGARYSAVWKELVNLERAGIVASEKTASARLYRLICGAPSFPNCAPSFSRRVRSVMRFVLFWRRPQTRKLPLCTAPLPQRISTRIRT